MTSPDRFDLNVLGNYEGLVISRSFPEGKEFWRFSYSFANFLNIVITPDEQSLVCYNGDAQGPSLAIHSSKTGASLATIPVRYAGFKEVLKVVPLPDKPSIVALIDVDKGNQIDIVQQKHVRSITAWDGTTSKVDMNISLLPM